MPEPHALPALTWRDLRPSDPPSVVPPAPEPVPFVEPEPVPEWAPEPSTKADTQAATPKEK